MAETIETSKLLALKVNITAYNRLSSNEKRSLDIQLCSNPRYFNRDREDIEHRKRKYIEERRPIITKARQYFDEKHNTNRR